MEFNFGISSTGQVTIDLFMEKETNFIVLHIQDLNVTDRVSFNNFSLSLKYFVAKSKLSCDQ